MTYVYAYAPLKHNDALDAYADMLVTYSDRRVRLATTWTVCAVLGVCVALLALATYWALKQHAATSSSTAASQSSGPPTRPDYDCPRYGSTALGAYGGGALHRCSEALRHHAGSHR